MSKRKKSYQFGLRAEKIAAWYLRLKGYRVLVERYHIFQGEIDVLAQKGKTLIAVEVKARQNFTACEDSITPWKQRKILKAVEYILSGSGKIRGLANSGDYAVRFDAIWIVPGKWPRHVINAWEM
jgi:putative endonuclease